MKLFAVLTAACVLIPSFAFSMEKAKMRAVVSVVKSANEKYFRNVYPSVVFSRMTPNQCWMTVGSKTFPCEYATGATFDCNRILISEAALDEVFWMSYKSSCGVWGLRGAETCRLFEKIMARNDLDFDTDATDKRLHVCLNDYPGPTYYNSVYYYRYDPTYLDPDHQITAANQVGMQFDTLSVSPN